MQYVNWSGPGESRVAYACGSIISIQFHSILFLFCLQLFPISANPSHSSSFLLSSSLFHHSLSHFHCSSSLFWTTPITISPTPYCVGYELCTECASPRSFPLLRSVPFPSFPLPSLSQFRISLVSPFKLSLSISLNPFSAPRTSFPVHYHLELEWFECQLASQKETTQRTITFYAIHHILSLVLRAISNSSVPPPLSDFLSVSLSAAAAGAHPPAPFPFKWLISEMCSFLRRYFSLIFRFALCLSRPFSDPRLTETKPGKWGRGHPINLIYVISADGRSRIDESPLSEPEPVCVERKEREEKEGKGT